MHVRYYSADSVNNIAIINFYGLSHVEGKSEVKLPRWQSSNNMCNYVCIHLLCIWNTA